MVPGSFSNNLPIYRLLVLPFPLAWAKAIGIQASGCRGCVGVACPALGGGMVMEQVSGSTQDC